MRAYTIGHSSRPIDTFIAMLDEHAVRNLVDVRRYPGSRHHPQFNKEILAASLDRHGVAYRHAPGLGGRRSPRTGSTNTAWRNAGFRGYADWMATPDFLAGMDRLIADIRTRATAVMCAEAVPWRCHRWLLADALAARGVKVVHILETGSVEAHELNANARLTPDGTITYPGGDPQIGLL